MTSSTNPSGMPVSVEGVLGHEGAFSWMKNKGIVKLNLMLILSLISSYATGYDGSMMNGLQSLDTWNEFFDNPGASELAL
jgi:hypothetical protein